MNVLNSAPCTPGMLHFDLGACAALGAGDKQRSLML